MLVKKEGKETRTGLRNRIVNNFINYQGCDKRIFLVRMRQFFLNQTYPKSLKIDAFGQLIFFCHNTCN